MMYSVKFKTNKTLKNVKVLVIIFLFIVLGISLLKYFNLYEGFSSDEPLTDYDPALSGICSEPTDLNAPGCFATVRAEKEEKYLNHIDSDYILKTQIETPVCPNTPFEYTNNGFGSLLSDDNRIITESDISPKLLSSNTSSSTNVSSGNLPSNNTLLSSNVSSGNLPSNNTLLSSNSTPSSLEDPYTIQSDLATNSAQNNSSGLNDLNLNYPILPANPAPATADTLKPDSMKCPPCPACDRCPEPSVECKRVVNYSASGSGNTPVPYINDFSKF